MQNQYFGDVGDFAKFGLLRCIVGAFTPAAKLGVIWYLTPDGFGNENDGKHVAYLERAKTYRHLDSGLFDLLQRSRQGGTPRSVKIIEESGLLGEARFVAESVPPQLARDRWFRRAAAGHVTDADVVFVDPDNGIETKNPNEKHVLWSELAVLLEAERPRSLVIYQHQDRSRLEEGENFPERYLNACAMRFPSMAACIALRARRGTVRAFIIIIHPQHEAAIRGALGRFISTWGAGRERDRIFEPNLLVGHAGSRSHPREERPEGALTEPLPAVTRPVGDDGLAGLLYRDLVGRAVPCPECSHLLNKWPSGWDSHAEYRCTIPGATPTERKAAYKAKYAPLLAR